jgi:mono/diheme cytochrome c family protein
MSYLGDSVSVKRTVVVGVAVLAIGFASQSLFAQASSTKDGTYTADQAQRGKVSYGKQCASCHGANLGGSGPTPGLSGPDFLANWDGQTLDELFSKIQATMPATNPGSLTKDDTADLLSYILSANKFPAGKADLPSDADTLKKIRIDKPQSQP